MALANVNLKFGLNLKDFDSKLNRVNKSLAAAGKKMSSMGKGLSVGLTAPILAAAGAAAALAGKVGQVADRLLDLEQITGISTGAIQEWQYVANQAGVNSETMTSAMEKLTTKLFDVTGAGNEGTKTLDALGIAYKDANGEFVSGENIMDDLISKLASMDNVVERNAMGAKLFGGSWKDIAPILSFGASGIEGLRKEANELGIVLSKDSLNGANDFRMGMDKLKITFDGLLNQLGASFAPMLNDTIIPILQNKIIPLFKSFTEFVGGLITSFKELSPTTQKIMLAVGALAVAIGPLLAALGAVLTMLPAIGAAFAVLTGPIGATVVAIGLLTGYIITHFDEIKIQARMAVLEMIDFGKKILTVVDTLAGAFPGFKATTTGALMALEVHGRNAAQSLVDTLGKEGKSAVDNVGESIKTMGQEALMAANQVNNLSNSTASIGINRTSDTGIQGPQVAQPGMDINIPEGIQGVTDKLDEAAPLWYQKAQEITDSFNTIINDGIINGLGAFGAGIGELIAGTASIGDVGNMLLGVLGGVLGQLGQLAIGTGIAVEAIKKALTSLGGVGAIAAGIALIALSKVVSSKAGGLTRGGGGGGGPLGAPSSIQGARAMGGSVQYNKPYLVGERGPELFTPSGYGSITPNSQMGGGSMTINITGRLVGQGNELVAVIDTQKRITGRTT